MFEFSEQKKIGFIVKLNYRAMYYDLFANEIEFDMPFWLGRERGEREKKAAKIPGRQTGQYDFHVFMFSINFSPAPRKAYAQQFQSKQKRVETEIIKNLFTFKLFSRKIKSKARSKNSKKKCKKVCE